MFCFSRSVWIRSIMMMSASLIASSMRVVDDDSQRLDVAGEHGCRAGDDHMGPHLGQAVDVGAGDAAVGDIADDGDLEPGDPSLSWTGSSSYPEEPGWDVHGRRRRR